MYPEEMIVLKQLVLTFGLRTTVDGLAEVIRQLANNGHNVKMYAKDKDFIEEDDLLTAADNLNESLF